jgi:hypothetical protein
MRQGGIAGSGAVALRISKNNMVSATRRGRQETPIPYLTIRCLRARGRDAKGRRTQGSVIVEGRSDPRNLLRSRNSQIAADFSSQVVVDLGVAGYG